MLKQIMPALRRSNAMLNSFSSRISDASEKLNIMKEDDFSICLKAGAFLSQTQ